MNDGTGLQYLLTDHLGSTVAVTNSSGTLTSQQRYLPFGAPRTIPNSPILGTDFTYTGQRKLDEGMGGVMDYRARFYSPALGRFQQPDTIIPDQSNPQSWNRFSYVSGNPLKYTDPTGHMQVCERGDEGIEGELHSSRCGSGANTEQIKQAFDKKYRGKGYSEYFDNVTLTIYSSVGLATQARLTRASSVDKMPHNQAGGFFWRQLWKRQGGT